MHLADGMVLGLGRCSKGGDQGLGVRKTITDRAA
jgi:hypothetical protein